MFLGHSRWILFRQFGQRGCVLFELCEAGVHRSLVFRDAQSGEVILGCSFWSAFDFEVELSDLPFGGYASTGGRYDDCGGCGVVFEGVQGGA